VLCKCWYSYCAIVVWTCKVTMFISVSIIRFYLSKIALGTAEHVDLYPLKRFARHAVNDVIRNTTPTKILIPYIPLLITIDNLTYFYI
jgi:hypothetical protein